MEAAAGDDQEYPYLRREMANMDLGDGVAGVPAMARFLLELSIERLTHRLTSIFQGFLGEDRVAMAEKSNQLPWLRQHRITVAAEGPIEVVFVTSAVGGTAGVLKYVVAYVRWLAGRLGLDVNCKLMIAPPAIGDAQSGNGISKAVRCGARLQGAQRLERRRRVGVAR